MPTTTADGLTVAKALRQARLIALALLAGQVLFLGIATALIATGRVEPGPADLSRTLGAACVLVFAVLLPVAFLLRRRLHGMGGGGGAGGAGGHGAAGPVARTGAAPSPDNLLKGHIIFFGLCEMVTLLCLAAALVQGALLPCTILALLCMGVQATNVPRGGEAG